MLPKNNIWTAGTMIFDPSSFGVDAHKNLIDQAEGLAPEAYSELERPSRYTVKTAPRRRGSGTGNESSPSASTPP